MAHTETALQSLLNNILLKINYKDPKINIKLVSSEGANYTSRLLEITIEDQDQETLQLFAKVGIFSDTLRKELGCQCVFFNEDSVYQNLPKAFEEIQEKYKIPKDDRYVFPKFYGSNLEEGNETFVFENLCAKGYEIFDRFETMDYRSVFDTTATLAKFHALGFALEKERPEMFNEFDARDELLEAFDTFVDSSKDKVVEYIQYLDEEYRSRLLKFLNLKGYDSYKTFYHKYGRKMLIHGDYRDSNIMHKRVGDKVLVVPVDYQGVRVGCGVTDLLYFITMSTNEGFRIKHFDELIEHYYNQLTLFLKQLGIDSNEVYPKEQYQKELKEMLPYTLFLALSLFPLIMVEAENAPKVDDTKADVAVFFIPPNAKSTEKLIGYIKDCIRWKVI